MEHLALDCSLALPELCAAVARALLLPEMRLDFENDTEWGSCEVDGIGYNVSRPYRRDTLRSWDPAFRTDARWASRSASAQTIPMSTTTTG